MVVHRHQELCTQPRTISQIYVNLYFISEGFDTGVDEGAPTDGGVYVSASMCQLVSSTWSNILPLQVPFHRQPAPRCVQLCDKRYIDVPGTTVSPHSTSIGSLAVYEPPPPTAPATYENLCHCLCASLI